MIERGNPEPAGKGAVEASPARGYTLRPLLECRLFLRERGANGEGGELVGYAVSATFVQAEQPLPIVGDVCCGTEALRERKDEVGRDGIADPLG